MVSKRGYKILDYEKAKRMVVGCRVYDNLRLHIDSMNGKQLLEVSEYLGVVKSVRDEDAGHEFHMTFSGGGGQFFEDCYIVKGFMLSDISSLAVLIDGECWKCKYACKSAEVNECPLYEEG